MDEKLRKIVAEALESPPDSIDESISQETFPAWSSLAHLRLITEIESVYGVQFSMDEALDLTSVAKLAARLARS